MVCVRELPELEMRRAQLLTRPRIAVVDLQHAPRFLDGLGIFSLEQQRVRVLEKLFLSRASRAGNRSRSQGAQEQAPPSHIDARHATSTRLGRRVAETREREHQKESAVPRTLTEHGAYDVGPRSVLADVHRSI